MPAAPEPSGEAIRRRVRRWALPSTVTAVAIDAVGGKAAWALGDGSICRASLSGEDAPEAFAVHEGAVLALAPAPGGLVSGGDDGQVVLTGADGGTRVLHREPRRWVASIAVHGESGLVVAAAGKVAIVIDRTGALVARYEDHPSTLTGVAINPTGKRVATAHYDGVSLWWVAAKQQKPQRLLWKGSHIGLSWSPSGKYLMTAMQENELHGWRLADSAALRMAGLAAKAKSLAWSSDSRWLANSGAEVVTCWDFSGKGPTGRPPAEIASGNGKLVTAVAVHPKVPIVAAGYEDGAVRLGRPGHGRTTVLEPVGAGPVTGVAWSPSGDHLVAGNEDGAAAIFDFTT